MWRYFLISLAITLVSAVAVYRIVQTTIVKADLWNEKAMASFGDVIPAIPERGKILADNGSILAANGVFYDAKIDWKSEAIKQDTFYYYLPALSDSLAAFFPGRKTAKQWEREFKKKFEQRKNPKARGLRNYALASNLTREQRDRLRSFPFFNKGSNKSGLVFSEQLRRSKPYGSIASRSIGQVMMDKLELDSGRYDDQIVMHGLTGLEGAFDSLLYGKNGQMQEVQSTVRTLRWEHVPAVNGYDLLTTINVEIQDIVEQELYDMCLEAEPLWGTAIVMDVESGEIKAVSNFERRDSFDISKGYFEKKNYAFLRNETGSVMKVISMLVALEDSIVVDVNERIPTGHTWAYSGGRPISDAHGSADKSVTEVISHSSNIGIAKIVTSKYGSNPKAFKERLREIGFFDPFNVVGIKGESTPFMYFGNHDNSNRIQLSRMSFGYGMSTPPIYTLAVYNAIANNGRFVRPTLLKQLRHDSEIDSVIPVTYVRERICSEANALKLREMMHAVVHDPHGTGKSLRNSIIDFGGKTGTAYVLDKGRYTSMKRYSFCGFFPYDNPKYSCMVVFERGKYGAAGSSGKVFQRIAMKMHARGMLDNGRDYTAAIDSSGVGKRGTMYVTAGKHDARSFVGAYAANSLVKMRSPRSEAVGKVPDVKGMGIRDAIDVLEGAGLKVKFTGVGYVHSQSLHPGSNIVKGAEITLALRN